MGQVSGGGESSRSKEGTTMEKLRTATFAIAAAFVALGSLVNETAAAYQCQAQPRDQYEIAINVNNQAANREVATNPRPVNYEEPA